MFKKIKAIIAQIKRNREINRRRFTGVGGAFNEANLKQKCRIQQRAVEDGRSVYEYD